jgi:hypothetical protein
MKRGGGGGGGGVLQNKQYLNGLLWQAVYMYYVLQVMLFDMIFWYFRDK